MYGYLAWSLLFAALSGGAFGADEDFFGVYWIVVSLCCAARFAYLARCAWRSRNESYTAAGPWVVEIREGGVA